MSEFLDKVNTHEVGQFLDARVSAFMQGDPWQYKEFLDRYSLTYFGGALNLAGGYFDASLNNGHNGDNPYSDNFINGGLVALDVINEFDNYYEENVFFKSWSSPISSMIELPFFDARDKILNDGIDTWLKAQRIIEPFFQSYESAFSVHPTAYDYLGVGYGWVMNKFDEYCKEFTPPHKYN